MKVCNICKMAENIENSRKVSEMESDDDDWNELSDDIQIVKCIFCKDTLDSTVALWEHCSGIHQFHITDFKRRFRLDYYDYIKMVNYIRNEKPTSKVLLQCQPPYPWDDDRFLQPVITDDPLLQYDIEDSDVEDNLDNGQDIDSKLENDCSNGDLSHKNEEIEDNQQKITLRLKTAEERARVAESALYKALSDLESMRTGVHSLLFGVEQQKGSTHRATSNHGELIDGADDEDGYFNTYSHYSIHEEMLKDKVRTLSYKNFIEQNSSLFEGKVILDIGCGSGILSIFAAQVGAKKVIGIDKSSIVYNAMEIVRENKLDNITLIRGKVEEVVLPVEEVDIIISEWMGYFLLFESMLDTVLFARDKWLSADGKVYPDKCSVSVVGVDDEKRRHEKLTFWEDVYGVNMSCMKRLVLSEPVIDIVDPDYIITTSCIIKEINVNQIKTKELNFRNNFQLEAIKDGTLNIIVGYFDIYFEESCTQKISFSTHPQSPATHWKQTVFHLENPMSLKKGEVVCGSIECKKNKQDVRSLDIVLELQDNTSKDIITNKYILQ